MLLTTTIRSTSLRSHQLAQRTTHIRTAAACLALLCLLLSGMPVSLSAQQGGATTVLVSAAPDGTATGNIGSFEPDVCADGRYIAFTSPASNLVEGDTNNSFDVFRRDLQTGETQLVSINREGTGSGNNFSQSPVISADGRYVAFASAARNLVENDTRNLDNVFVRDMQQGITELVSITRSGVGGGAGGIELSISDDGRYVVFRSTRPDFVQGDDGVGLQVYRRDLQADVTELVSINIGGVDAGNTSSYRAVMSADGRYIAFFSTATNLVEGVTNGFANVYVRDMQRGIAELVSVSRSDPGVGSGSFPAISADGRHVAFISSRTDLVDVADTNNTPDVFVRDLERGVTQMVSINRAGTGSGNLPSYLLYDSLSISGDGRYVAFTSLATDLVDGADTNRAADVFVRDTLRGETQLASRNVAGTGTGTLEARGPVISRDGRYVIFASRATNLAANDDSRNQFDLFARDIAQETTELVSVNRTGIGGGDGTSGTIGSDTTPTAAMSADGRTVAFSSGATNLVEASDTNGNSDVFARIFPRPAAACASDASNQVSITRGDLRYQRRRERYIQAVTLTNITDQELSGPLTLVVDELSGGATLLNTTGTTECAAPASPYVEVTAGEDGVLSPGESTRVVLRFSAAAGSSIDYRVRVLTGINR